METHQSQKGPASKIEECKVGENGEQHNYGDQLHEGGLDDDVEEEQEMSQDENLGDAHELPPVQLRRSNRYTSDEYVTLTDREELGCYHESTESEERQKAWQSKLQKYVALSTTKVEVGFVQDEQWLFCDTNNLYLGWVEYVIGGSMRSSLKSEANLFIAPTGSN
ncbi:hypothetical protein CR513_21784, partial [Mucuna pruriens]